MIRVSAFSSLDATDKRVFVQDVTRARLLPRCCGTYVFYDREGEPLYIGKAKNLRVRVRSHLRRPDTRYLLPHWSHLIAEIEVRPAGSEIEALLVEADLVARLRPSFNRQMRSWSRYCYLVRTDDPAGPLTISTQLQPWRTCFGPFRSRRQAVDIIEGVYHLLSRRHGCPASLEKLHALLAGTSDALVLDLESHREAAAGRNPDEDRAKLLLRVSETLRKAFARTALLHDAERLLGGLIVLPGLAKPRTCVVINQKGLHLGTLEPNARDAAAFLDRYREWLADTPPGADQRLPKAVSDCLCVASRQLRQSSSWYRFAPLSEAAGYRPEDLLAFAFDDLSDEQEPALGVCPAVSEVA